MGEPGHIPYGYARALEVEGRHPRDAGQWGATGMRLLYREGLPFLLDEYAVPILPDGTFGPTPSALRRAFHRNRCRFYRRVRSANEAAAVIKARGVDALTKVCLPLSSGWVDPADGVIPMPTAGEGFAPDTHAIRLHDSLRLGGVAVGNQADAPHFLFENSWGGGWGKHGYGLLPFAYYDSFAFEHYSQYFNHELHEYRHKRLGVDAGRWHARDEFNRRMYAFEIVGTAGDRIGWAFAIETPQAIELEELYVAPEHRRAGVGGRLAALVVGLSAAKRSPLRVWGAFADAPAESPVTGDALPKMAKRLGVQFQPCPVRWAAYFATNEMPGADIPPEPSIPGRPRSTLGALTAFALVVGNLGGSGGPQLPPGPPLAAAKDESDWAAMNARRAALIHKKNRGGLDPAERAEFDHLQAHARSRAEAAHPLPPLMGPALQALLNAKASGP